MTSEDLNLYAQALAAALSGPRYARPERGEVLSLLRAFALAESDAVAVLTHATASGVLLEAGEGFSVNQDARR